MHRHIAPLDDRDRLIRDGRPVTSLTRTALDLARVVRPDEALAVMDAACRLLGSSDQFAQLQSVPFRQCGAEQVRFAIEHANPLAESPGESRSRYWMIAAGLPLPQLQVELHDPAGEFIARVDFGWLDRGLIGEFDGRIKYQPEFLRPSETAADVVMREKRREGRIRELGLWVCRWVSADLNDGGGFAAWLRRQLDARPTH